MKLNKIILVLIIFALAVNCAKKPSEPPTDYNRNADSMVIQESDAIAEPLPQTCYLGTVSMDFVFLMLEDNLGTLTYKMRYKHYVKESSLGDVIGSQNGDTIKLLYTNYSEKTFLASEIYFLKQGDNLVE